ncbi:MAG: tRNA pseudouridine(38-40) synthase TruA [Ruminococcaceae bacterium]|nr:tRNA pseudouridine(38-40) synthase TruA [Oscillospiraceae bacterium]
MKYFAKINYLGTDFHGFQVQPGLRTVQGELCSALAETFSAPVKVTGCSRTDAGVHANEFCVKIECDTATVPADKLSIAASRFLPNDISLFYAEICGDDFHPRYDAVSKEYLYRIINRRVYDPFEYGRAWFYPREITEAHIERMREAARYIIGKKDFSSFMSEGSCAEDTVREVFYLDIKKNGDLIEVKICADGFLYNMVRIIVGTLIETAHGRFSPEDLKIIIESKDRTRAGMTAPPEGLYLNKVNY